MTTTATPRPTGRREERHGETHLVFERTFRAPIEDVWAAVTESGRLSRWIGEGSGDPASGSVTFRMTAEGDDVGAVDFDDYYPAFKDHYRAELT